MARGLILVKNALVGHAVYNRYSTVVSRFSLLRITTANGGNGLVLGEAGEKEADGQVVGTDAEDPEVARRDDAEVDVAVMGEDPDVEGRGRPEHHPKAWEYWPSAFAY